MLDQYNLFVQQQVESYNQIARRAEQDAYTSAISNIQANNIKLIAIKNFNDLLASQKTAYDFSQKINDINYGKAVQNIWALQKSSDVNSDLIVREGSAQIGQLESMAARSGVVSNKGTINTLSNQIRTETNRATSNADREANTQINSALDSVISLTLEKAISKWDFDQKQDFMKRSFVESI